MVQEVRFLGQVGQQFFPLVLYIIQLHYPQIVIRKGDQLVVTEFSQ